MSQNTARPRFTSCFISRMRASLGLQPRSHLRAYTLDQAVEQPCRLRMHRVKHVVKGGTEERGSKGAHQRAAFVWKVHAE